MTTRKKLTSVSIIATAIVTSSSLPLYVFAEETHNDSYTAPSSDTTKSYQEQYQARLTQAAQKKEEFQEKYNEQLTLAAQKKEEYREQYNDKLTEAAQKKDEVRENIDEAKEDALARAKEHILDQVDRIITYLESLKDKTNNSLGLSDEQKAAAIAELDTYINQLEEMKGQVEAAETFEDLRSQATFAKEIWQDYNGEHRKYVGLNVAGRFQEFLDKLSSPAERLALRLDEIEANHDVDLTEVRTALANFETAMAQAQELIDEAVALFNTIGSDGVDATATYNAGMAKLREAKTLLKDAYEDLREAIISAKEALGELDTPEK